MARPVVFADDPILGQDVTPVAPASTLDIANSVDARLGDAVFAYYNPDASTLEVQIYIWDGTQWVDTGDVLVFSEPGPHVQTYNGGTYLALTGTPSSEGADWYLRVGVRT